MKFFKKVFDFYLYTNIPIAVSAYAMVKVTYFNLQLKPDKTVSYFVFFGTLLGYIFVKHFSLFTKRIHQYTFQRKTILILALISLSFGLYNYLKLANLTKIIVVLTACLVFLYTIPIVPNKQNLRNRPSLKIHIVALCWTIATVILPVLNASKKIDFSILMFSINRYIFVFVLLLIFEIHDLNKDPKYLKTIPQQIGITRTKILGYLLLIIYFLIENKNLGFQLSTLVFLTITAIALSFSNPKNSKYYTLFWIESIPVFWWIFHIIY
jgi:hypothetical protein